MTNPVRVVIHLYQLNKTYAEMNKEAKKYMESRTPVTQK